MNSSRNGWVERERDILEAGWWLQKDRQDTCRADGRSVLCRESSLTTSDLTRSQRNTRWYSTEDDLTIETQYQFGFVQAIMFSHMHPLSSCRMTTSSTLLFDFMLPEDNHADLYLRVQDSTPRLLLGILLFFKLLTRKSQHFSFLSY